MNPEVIGGFPKGKTRKQLKERKDRAEANVKKAVRARCFERDSECRLKGISEVALKDSMITPLYLECAGYAEWAHTHQKRRSQTRGQAPEIRHDTQHSLMLCRFHHAEYDAHRLIITALSRKGADGPLRFRRAK